jgi:DNA-binding GntR family transcriptional regulator
VSRFLALDSQFHSEIARISGNHFIIEAVERGLAARYAPFGALLRRLTPRANNGHQDLVEAIAAGNGARAEKLMRTHVATARNTIISTLNRHLRAQTGA